jgi:hypothetical protein
MKKSKLTATSLRSFMIFVIILAMLLACGGFYLAQNQLDSFSSEVTTAVAQATTGGNKNTSAIARLKNDIKNNKAVFDKAAAIKAPTQTVQDQTMKDLNLYAARTGISIKDYSFGQPANAAAVSGLSYVTISINNPVLFSNLIKFFQAIETNLPKLQLTGINLNSSSSGYVTSSPLIIGIYTR